MSANTDMDRHTYTRATALPGSLKWS